MSKINTQPKARMVRYTFTTSGPMTDKAVREALKRLVWVDTTRIVSLTFDKDANVWTMDYRKD